MPTVNLQLDPALLVELVRRFLKAGTPPTTIAEALDMDPEPIKQVATNMRREMYGTTEISEMNTFLVWKAGEKLLRMVESGSPDVAFRAVQMIMGKSLGISARQTPEELINAREALAALATAIDVADAEAEDEATAYERMRSQFVISELEDGDDADDDI